MFRVRRLGCRVKDLGLGLSLGSCFQGDYPGDALLAAHSSITWIMQKGGCRHI